MKKVIIILLLLLYFQDFSWAHPGHGLIESNLIHYLFSGYHLGLIVFTIGIMIVAGRLYKTKRNFS